MVLNIQCIPLYLVQSAMRSNDEAPHGPYPAREKVSQKLNQQGQLDNAPCGRVEYNETKGRAERQTALRRPSGKNITKCNKMRHSLSLPTVTYICMGELPYFHHSPTTSFLHSQPIQAPPSGPGFVCAGGQIFIWDDPSCHVSQLIVHQGCSTPLPTMWYDHLVLRLSASVESRKLFLDGSLCLAGRWPWSGCLGSSSWRQRSALAATFRRMWGGAIPASAYKQGIGVAFKQPVIILHVSFRAMSTWPVCLERPHEGQAYSAVEKQSANAVVRTVAG